MGDLSATVGVVTMLLAVPRAGEPRMNGSGWLRQIDC